MQYCVTLNLYNKYKQQLNLLGYTKDEGMISLFDLICSEKQAEFLEAQPAKNCVSIYGNTRACLEYQNQNEKVTGESSFVADNFGDYPLFGF